MRLRHSVNGSLIEWPAVGEPVGALPERLPEAVASQVVPEPDHARAMGAQVTAPDYESVQAELGRGAPTIGRCGGVLIGL